MNIDDIITVWLYAYSSHESVPQRTYYTEYVATTDAQRRRGRPILAQISLSYLTCVTTFGAGALISGFTPPFGPAFVTTDFADNSMYVPQAIAVTFELSARAAESYAAGVVYLL